MKKTRAVMGFKSSVLSFEEWKIGAPGKAYTQWEAKMAVGLGTGVPWVICKQNDSPDPVSRISLKSREREIMYSMTKRLVDQMLVEIQDADVGAMMFFLIYKSFDNVIRTRKGLKSGASMKCSGCQGFGMKVSIIHLDPFMIQQMHHP